MELGHRESTDVSVPSGPDVRDFVKALKTLVWLAMGLVAGCDWNFMIGKTNSYTPPPQKCLIMTSSDTEELERLREEIAELTLQLNECSCERSDLAPDRDVYDEDVYDPAAKYLPPPGPAPTPPLFPSRPGGTGDAGWDYLDEQMKRDVYRGTPPAQPTPGAAPSVAPGAPSTTPPPKQNDIGTLDIL